MLKTPANIEVLFIDAIHPEHNAMTAYGWIKRGQKRKVKTNSGGQRLNLHGVFNAENSGGNGNRIGNCQDRFNGSVN